MADPTRGGRPGETIVGLNPLITDDTIWHCLTLAACYQLAQSILKIARFCASKKGRIGGGWRVSAQGARCTWQLPWLAVENWSVLAGPFLPLLAQTGSETTSLSL